MTPPTEIPVLSDSFVPNEGAKAAYTPVINLYMQENSITWARFNAMITANAFVFAAFGVSANAGLYLVALTLPLVGLLLCYWWARIMHRGFEYMDFWRARAIALETLAFEPPLRTVGESEERLRPQVDTMRARHFAGRIIWTVRALYVVALIQMLTLVYETCACSELLSCLVVKHS